jgi:subtilisin family serine protease
MKLESKVVGAVAALAGAHAARLSRRKHKADTAEDFIVLFKEGASDRDIVEFCAGRCALMGHPSSGGVAFAQVHGSVEMETMVRAKAEQVDLYEPDGTDYLIPELEAFDAARAASWGLERVGVPTAAFTGRGQTIYVQDTGVRTSHNDFGGRAFAAIDLTTDQGVEVCDPASTTCATDRQGHGTHCAATAAGTTFGVATSASVFAVKTLSDRGSGARSWQMAAIDWVTVNGPKPSIISMSLGGSGSDPAYTKAIGAATAAGITVVVAAGNSNSDSCNFSPAFAADAITVGATTSSNERASYSNYGQCNNIMAPGSAIVSASASSNTGSRALSGTSMACPHVSGAAALLLESDPSLNRDQILSTMLEVSRKGFIAGLKRNDPNQFLWVGAEAPPGPAPSPPSAPVCPWYCSLRTCLTDSCSDNCDFCQDRSQTFAGVPVQGYREDAEDWIVLFAEGTTDEDIQIFCGKSCSFMGHPSSGGVAFAQVHGRRELESMVFLQSTHVELLEPDNKDYLIPELEDLDVASTASTASWGLERVGVPQRGFTGKGQTIYVQDTGVRTSHTDFGGRAFAGIDLTTGQGVEVCDAASTTCAGDRQGHGTHCAGSAAGTRFGVASGATVQAVKTLSDQGSGARSWQMAAIDWVTVNGAKPSVISMSLGGSGADPAYTKAIGAATAAGITVVVAAGNSNADACNFSPAFAAEAITVGATTNSNQRASYSNYGQCNNIMAPGSAIVSASASSNTGSRSLSGTSMACPHVSGAAALMLEADPSLNRDQILQAMIDSSRKGLISGLKRNDPTEFLWVGSSPPTRAPPSGETCPWWCATRMCAASECKANCDFCE